MLVTSIFSFSENAFPTMFSTQSDKCIPFVHIFDITSLFAAELEEPKIGISGQGLNLAKSKNLSLGKKLTLYQMTKL